MIKLKKKHRRYSNYKDSGIEWIGEIPKEWEIKKLKFCSSVQFSSVDKHIFDDERKVSVCNYTDVYYGEIISNDENFRQGSCNPVEYQKYKLKKGDVIITKDSETADDIAVPAYIAKDFENAVCGYHLALIHSSKDLNGKFLFRFFQSDRTRKYFEINANGVTRFGLGKSKIENLHVPIIPTEEQKRIATYLDEKTALLDSIIKKKKQQIELLKEKRTALINKAVTRGLDDNAEMKDSGVEWIGEIPKDWKVEKLKFASIINRNSLGENTEPDYLLKYVDIGNVTIEGIKRGPEEMLFENAPSRARRIVKAGNTILGTVRTYLKAIAYLEKPESNLIVSTGFAVIEARKNKFEDKYLYYLILSEQFVNRVVAYSKGVSYPAINSTELGNLPVFIPPKDEQIKIIAYLEEENQRIEYAIGKIEESISFLQEYKTSLISNVVTGKINVMTI